MFKKILVANRGEIAVRIIRTCKRLGIETLAVYSEADYRSPYVREANEACFIGPAPAKDSFLDKQKIIDAALFHHCEAIHPGYGFLSESSEFAQMVNKAKLVFIGPSASAIATLGDKIASKAIAIKAGIPVVPGLNEPISNEDEAIAIAEQIGFPVLVKPASGGGGRGMRIVWKKEDMSLIFQTCREETCISFSDDRIFIEQYIPHPRHIEIQILADTHGNIIYFPERECSIQRRYQKIIEETPSTAIDEILRKRMGKIARTLARQVGYTNAGTVEFILDAQKNFYFLEMNTRLQVEHPITELITSLDLVELQLQIACGDHLSIKQDSIICDGWSIEARICAEDPARDFFPSIGMITRYSIPNGKHIRIDSGIDAGSLVSIYYDSLLAKVAVWGENREEAIRTMNRALNGFHIEGITTNIDFVNSIINHPSFSKGDLSTDFISTHFKDGKSLISVNTQQLHFMVIAAVLIYHARQELIRTSLKPMTSHVGTTPLQTMIYQYIARTENHVFEAELDSGDFSGQQKQWTIYIDDQTYDVISSEFEYYWRIFCLKISGSVHVFRIQYHRNHIQVSFGGYVLTFDIFAPQEWSLARYMVWTEKTPFNDVIKCPMPGMITSICVQEGDYVRQGQELIRMESMKMETGIASPIEGQIHKILVQIGQNVDTEDVLLKLDILKPDKDVD